VGRDEQGVGRFVGQAVRVNSNRRGVIEEERTGGERGWHLGWKGPL
jgi:hypothetical protein